MFCTKCGSANVDGARYCYKCGSPLAIAPPPAREPFAAPVPSVVIPAEAAYAGFWRRFAALILDGFIIGACGVAAGVVLGVITALGNNGFATGFVIGYYVVSILAGWLYPALMESSESQATIGKRALGIYVTDTSAQRISFGRATGRTFAKFLNPMTLGIGWLMAAFTEQKRALHDYVAGTLVVSRSDRRTNAAVVALIASAAALPIIGIIAAIAIPGLLRARQAGNEAVAIGALRAINAAQTTYAASCAGGGYAQALDDLAKAPPGEMPFIDAGLASGQTRGYYVTVEDGLDAVDVQQAQDTCNGSARGSRSTYFAHAEPIEVGSTGQRSFATNETGTIYQAPTGTAIPKDLTGARALE